MDSIHVQIQFFRISKSVRSDRNKLYIFGNTVIQNLQGKNSLHERPKPECIHFTKCWIHTKVKCRHSFPHLSDLWEFLIVKNSNGSMSNIKGPFTLTVSDDVSRHRQEWVFYPFLGDVRQADFASLMLSPSLRGQCKCNLNAHKTTTLAFDAIESITFTFAWLIIQVDQCLS